MEIVPFNCKKKKKKKKKKADLLLLLLKTVNMNSLIIYDLN
jgi:hypothetical protein